MSNTLKDKLMERYNLSEFRATQIVNSTGVKRVIELLAEENGVLQAAAMEALRERELAVKRSESESTNRLLEAKENMTDAQIKCKHAEEVYKSAQAAREQAQAMLCEMRTLETAEARDKLRLLEIFLALKGAGPDGRPYTQAYLSSCASILSGVPMQGRDPV